MISVWTFGAKGNGVDDDYIPIQKAIDYCIEFGFRVLFFPSGRYKISKGLLIVSKSTNPFCSLDLLGEGSFFESAPGSVIIPTFKNSFVIGLQRNKGSKISKISIEGLYKSPVMSLMDFYQCDFDNYKDPSCSDDRCNPYSGIAIDPCNNDNWDNHSGSTGIEIYDCAIENVMVGITSSSNSHTQNAENTIIDKVRFGDMKLCIAAGQAQEKMNRVTRCSSWGVVHTVFANDYYGKGNECGNWTIDGFNIANQVNRFIRADMANWFPINVKNVIAEGLGIVGIYRGGMAASMENCHFVLVSEKVGGKRLHMLGNIDPNNIVYRSCNFLFNDPSGFASDLQLQGRYNLDKCSTGNNKLTGSHNLTSAVYA